MASTEALVCLDDYEKYAKDHMEQKLLGYFIEGTDAEITLKENSTAFSRLKILPRVLKDVSNVDLSTSILGQHLDFPVCIAPSAFHKLVSPGGELDTANAANAMGTCMVLSNVTTTTLEKVASLYPDTLKWFQLYIWECREFTVNLIRRAETAGFKSLVVTVDSSVKGNRRGHRFTFPPNIEVVHLPQELKERSGRSPCSLADPSLTWEFIAWMRSVTKLPIVLKGILSPEDALLAVEHKVDGIIVSNHGGRQLDTVPATIEMLPHIIAAVRGRIEVYVDGGIRTGTDVFKALAMGARAVFIGRPIIYGLKYAGGDGAKQVLQILKDELMRTMALSGCSKISEIKPSHVVHQSELLKTWCVRD
ncbi:2-Hydroxyacid oxidase 2-like [Saccoglossus kowalevskii]